MKLLKILVDLFVPWPLYCPSCNGINRGESLLCDKCARRLEGESPIMYFTDSVVIDRAAAAHNYESASAAMVTFLKYHGVSSNVDPMAQDMCNALEKADFPSVDMITWVPAHWLRRNSRFLDHCKTLSKRISRITGLPIANALVRTRLCRRQATLKTDAQRINNVSGAFRVRHNVSGKRVLLIDDVYTTGATATECAKALKAAGATHVYLLTYAVVANRIHPDNK